MDQSPRCLADTSRVRNVRPQSHSLTLNREKVKPVDGRKVKRRFLRKHMAIQNQSETEARSPSSRGEWFVLAAAVLWGTTGTAQAFAPEGTQPAVVGAVRLAIGGFALLALASARGVLRDLRGWPLFPTALGALCMAAYQVLFFEAVTKTGVAVGTIVAIGSGPLFAGGLGFIMRRENPGRQWMIATFLAIAGCVLLTLPKAEVSVNPAGVGLALGAGVTYATCAVAAKGLVEERPPDAVMAVLFCLAAVLLSPLLFLGDLTWLAHGRGMAVALHLGLVATAASYTLFARGLEAVPVATAVTLGLAEPFTAAALGVVVLAERLTGSVMIGAGLILAGLVMLSIQGRSKGP
jgi:drug/metabolite transporter, DME family